MTALWVALGAVIGAPLRYIVDRGIQSRIGGVFPWGTLVVNIAGSFVLGMIMSAAADGRVSDELAAVGGAGFCGALTTYSTFSYETLRLYEGGARWYTAANIVVSIAAGLASAAFGWWLVG